jgi:hypothetical protein
MYRVRAAINGQQGLPGLFTAYYDATGGPSAVDAATVAGRVRGAWDVLKTVVVSGATIQVNPQVDVINELNGELISSFAIATPAVVTGTGSGTPGRWRSPPGSSTTRASSSTAAASGAGPS